MGKYDDKYYSWACGARNDGQLVMISRVKMSDEKDYSTSDFYSV